MEYWSDEEYPNIRDEIACRYTRRLTLQGRELVAEQTEKLTEMISGLPEWSDGWASAFTEEHFGSVGSIGTNEAPDTIIETAEHSFLSFLILSPTRFLFGKLLPRFFLGIYYQKNHGRCPAMIANLS